MCLITINGVTYYTIRNIELYGEAQCMMVDYKRKAQLASFLAVKI